MNSIWIPPSGFLCFKQTVSCAPGPRFLWTTGLNMIGSGLHGKSDNCEALREAKKVAQEY